MNTIDTYIQAATRENTRRSYRAAIEHFEVHWGGFLPATSDMVARYLADNAAILSANTLKLRLAGLSQWHLDQGMPDPTKAPMVKKVLKGIRALHPAQEKQATPFQLVELEQLDGWLAQQIHIAQKQGNDQAQLKHVRDRALVLLGFWRGFRSDELSRIEIQNVQLVRGEGMSLFLPFDKNHFEGNTYKAPALARLCPVDAYQAWVELSSLDSGPVFRSINRWGHISEHGLHAGSFIPLLRDLFARAEIPSPESYSSHSLRRGFASWATANGWDLKTLMNYIGWKDMRSAMRYLPVNNPFAQLDTHEKLLKHPAPNH